MALAAPKMPSNRRFGLLFTAVFALLALYEAYKGGTQFLVGSLIALSAAVGTATAFAPQALAPFNKAWFLLGLLLGKFVSPVILGVIFFGLLTPVALVGRWLGRDELRLSRKPAASYWVDRVPPGPAADSFKNQW